MKRLIAIFVSIMVLGGCYNAPDKLKPMPWIFDMMPKDAPNNYKRGWKDGCESGLANMTNSIYRKFYTFRQDASLREDVTYYKVWKDTYDFCRHYAYGTLRESDQRQRLPNNQTTFQSTFMGGEGIFTHGLLHMWGPGDALLPLNKVGHIGGSGYVGTGQSEREVIGGVGTLDYSDDTKIGNQEGGLNMDFGKDVPFFGASDPR